MGCLKASAPNVCYKCSRIARLVLTTYRLLRFTSNFPVSSSAAFGTPHPYSGYCSSTSQPTFLTSTISFQSLPNFPFRDPNLQRLISISTKAVLSQTQQRPSTLHRRRQKRETYGAFVQRHKPSCKASERLRYQ